MTLTADDWSVEVRDSTLRRVAAITGTPLTTLQYTWEAHDTGSWSLSLPDGDAACVHLCKPGAGIVIHDPWGRTFSGPVTKRKWVHGAGEDLGDHWELTGAADTILLDRMPLLPDPDRSLGSQGESAVWTGPRDTLIARALQAGAQTLGYAPATGVLNDGTQAVLTVDWQTILEACQSLANGQWRFGVRQTDADTLEAFVERPSDLTGRVTLDAAAGSLTGLTTRGGAPSCTRCICKSTTNNVTTYTLVIPDAGRTLEATWGVHCKLVDLEGGETATARATQEVSDAMSGMTGASGTAANDTILDDVQPGDTVGVYDGLGDLMPASVDSITTGFTDGPIRTFQLGDWSASDSRLLLALAQRDTTRRVSRLERTMQ